MTDKAKLNFTKDNTLNIYGDFDDSIMIDIIPRFEQLIEESENFKDPKIIINIRSNGGQMSVLLQLLSLVEKAKSKGVIIETVVLAHAYSCGSMLAASGSKGYRYVGEYSEHLIHAGSWSPWRVTTEEQMNRGHKYFKKAC